MCCISGGKVTTILTYKYINSLFIHEKSKCVHVYVCVCEKESESEGKSRIKRETLGYNTPSGLHHIFRFTLDISTESLASLLLLSRETDSVLPFYPPSWACVLKRDYSLLTADSRDCSLRLTTYFHCYVFFGRLWNLSTQFPWYLRCTLFPLRHSYTSCFESTNKPACQGSIRHTWWRFQN